MTTLVLCDVSLLTDLMALAPLVYRSVLYDTKRTVCIHYLELSAHVFSWMLAHNTKHCTVECPCCTVGGHGMPPDCTVTQ